MILQVKKKTENNFEKSIGSQNESYTSQSKVSLWLVVLSSRGNGAKSCILATS
jgi:hypothetical protein